LIVSANKDLYDFNPSPYSRRYFGVADLDQLFRAQAFSCEFFGVSKVDAGGLRQKLLRPVKLLAVKMNIIPRTMTGKKLLKRLVFGKLEPIPVSIDPTAFTHATPARLPADAPDRRFKVIYAVASLET